jgi:drug/metabolite transporter (DMT)-like permease
VALFLGVIIVMAPFMVFFMKVDPAAWLPINLLILSGIVFFSIIANLLSYYAIKWEKLTNLEPVRLLEPLFVVLLAFAFFKSERNPVILIPSIIAALALVFSHVRKHHLDFNKYILAGIASSFFYAIDLILTKLILEYYNPISLYFIRCSLILIITITIFSPHSINKLTKKEKLLILVISLFWVTFRVATYYGYLYLGVVSTTLVLMLGPVFIYLLARIFLKEKLNWRNIVATIIILGCVAYAILN